MSIRELSKKWNKIIDVLTKQFGNGEKLDLTGVLFLVGIQELGMGLVELKKDQKIDVIHLAVCSLLSDYGYYKYDGVDNDGWPHYTLNKKLPALSKGQENYLLKEAIVNYFQL